MLLKIASQIMDQFITQRDNIQSRLKGTIFKEILAVD
jgi:hypothetical protein